MPPNIALCTCPMHASAHFTVHFLYAYFAVKLRLCSRSSGDVLCILLWYLKVATLQPDPCRRWRADREDMRRFTRDQRESSDTRNLRTGSRRHARSPQRAARARGKSREKMLVFAPRPRRSPQRVVRVRRKNRKKNSFCISTTPIPQVGHTHFVVNHFIVGLF